MLAPTGGSWSLQKGPGFEGERTYTSHEARFTSVHTPHKSYRGRCVEMLCLSSWEAGVDCISPLLLAGESLLTHKSMVGRGQGVSQRGFPSPLMWHKKGLLHCPVEAQLTLKFEEWMDRHTATSSSLLFSIRWLHSCCLFCFSSPIWEMLGKWS